MKKVIRFGLLVSRENTVTLAKAIMNVGELVFRELDKAQVIVSDSVDQLAEAGRVYAGSQPILVLIGDGSVASSRGWQHIPSAHQAIHELTDDLRVIVAICLA